MKHIMNIDIPTLLGKRNQIRLFINDITGIDVVFSSITHESISIVGIILGLIYNHIQSLSPREITSTGTNENIIKFTPKIGTVWNRT